jgi:hypothetical protein
VMLSFNLEFRPQRERPTEEGDYLLYNQCDGFHLVQWCDEMEFHAFDGTPILDDWFQAWAKLPVTHAGLYDVFADKPVGGKSARDVTMERLAAQRAGA